MNNHLPHNTVIYVSVGIALLAAAPAMATSIQKEQIQPKPLNCYTALPAPLSLPDYVVTPTPSSAYQYSKLSLAVPAAQLEGDRNYDGTIRICIEGGNAQSGPVVYLDSIPIPTDPWVNVLNGSGTEPVAIYAPAGSQYTVIHPSVANVSTMRFYGKAPDRQFTVTGLQLRSGTAVNGAGVHVNRSRVTLNRMIFNGNTAVLGAGVRNLYGDLSVNQSQFLGNSATEGGGIASDGGVVTTSNNLFKGNIAANGGAIRLSETSLIDEGSTMVDNQATVGVGGAIKSTHSSSYLTGTTIERNTATTRGGGVYSYGGSLALTSALLSENTAEFGGGIYTTAGTLQLAQTIMNANHAILWGGAVHADYGNKMVVTQSLFSDNIADENGGALYTEETVTAIAASQFHDNSSLESGGALRVVGSGLTVDASQFHENRSIKGGAAFMTNVNSTIDDSIFTNNQATVLGSPSQNEHGGALHIQGGTLVLHDSSFENNFAAMSGGAVAGSNITFLDVVDTAFITNTANLYGGAVYLGNSTGTFTQVTGESNSAVRGGGFAFLTALTNITVNDSVINNNSALFPLNRGGGAFNNVNSTFTATGLTSNGNTCGYQCEGGFLYAQGGEVSLTQSTITDNTSAYVAGGLRMKTGTLTVTNSIIAGNSELGVLATGHALWLSNGSTGTITNSAVVGNGTGGSNPIAYGIKTDNASLSVTNSILAYNRGQEISTDAPSSMQWTTVYDDTLPTLTASSQTVLAVGIGNLEVNPQFVGDSVTTNPFLTAALGAFDFNLQSGSPLIDAGNPAIYDNDGSVSDISAYGGPLGVW